MKRIFGIITGVLLAGTIAGEVHAMASRTSDPVLVVIPDRYATVQLGMDLVGRHRVVLVTYSGNASEPVLHAWNGSNWVYVNMQDYRDAAFLKVLPTEAVLVGDEATLPRVLLDATDWCSRIWEVPSLQTSDLVNAFGKVLAFKSGEWIWFSKRYNLDVEGKKKQDSWYFHPYVAPAGAPVPAASESTNEAEAADAPVPAEAAMPAEGAASEEPPPVPLVEVEEEHSAPAPVVEDTAPPPAPVPSPAPRLSLPALQDAEMEEWSEEAVAQ